MFKLQLDDIEIMFEYDTKEEYEQYLSSALKAQEELKKMKLEHYETVKSSVERVDKKDFGENLRLEELWQKFVVHSKRNGKTLEQITEYERAYKKLVDYFGHKKNVYEITFENVEEFKVHLHNNVKVRGKNLTKQTINKHLNYFKAILESQRKDYLKKLASDIETYSKSVIKKDMIPTENYTEEEIKKILTFDYKDKLVEAVIKIALYSGMRQGEIRTLEQEDIIQDSKTGIYYFNITEAKSEAGIRQIPVHKDILDLVLNLSFPLFPEFVNNKNAFGKKVRYQLYKAVNEKHKTFHTLRANLIDNIVDNNLESNNKFILNIIKEIVGHSEFEKNKITLKVYKKGFKLKDKKECIDNVNYFL